MPHRFQSPTAWTARPSPSIQRICEVSTGKNDSSLQSLTSETKRKDRKWVYISGRIPMKKLALD